MESDGESDGDGEGDDWVQDIDPSTNRKFWFNKRTEESTWTKPTASSNSAKGATKGGKAAKVVEPTPVRGQRQHELVVARWRRGPLWVGSPVPHAPFANTLQWCHVNCAELDTSVVRCLG